MLSVNEIGKKARAVQRSIAIASTQKKNEALLNMSLDIEKNADAIIEANKKDLEEAKKNGMSASLLDRLMLDKQRIDGIAKSIKDIVELPDPVGRKLSEYKHPNGMIIDKVSTPIGVIAVIFEARPNVTADAASLCLKSGNVSVLRGGREALNSNMTIMNIMRGAVSRAGFSPDIMQLIEDVSHESANELMNCNDYIDVLIPRGGKNLIKTVVKNSTVPVIETGAGNCHIYVDSSADIDMAADIVYNAKVSRPSVCNAAESLLVHRDIAEIAIPAIYERLKTANVTVRGDEITCALIPEAEKATDEDYATEYGDYIISCKVVDDIDEAIDHITKYSTGHSESIVTNDKNNAERFLNEIDSAAVYVNASTRFTDGGVFGFGAEIGISTQKLHARGPLGLPELTSFKYQIRGNGQIR